MADAGTTPDHPVQDTLTRNASELQRSERAFVTGVVWQVLRSAGLDVSDPSAYACSFTLTMLGTTHRIVMGDPTVGTAQDWSNCP